MRGNASRRPSHPVPALLAGAALLAGSIGVPVIARERGIPTGMIARPLQIAFAVPRVGPRATAGGWPRASAGGWHDDEVGLPHPLDDADAARARKVFAWRAAGELDRARRAAPAHGNPLLDEILGDRPPAVRPPAVRPPAGRPPAGRSTLAPGFARNRMLDRTVRQRLGHGVAGARSALRLVARTRFPDPRYEAALRAEVAQALFADGDDALALQTARRAAQQPGARGEIGLAGYVAGLASWRQGDTRLAQGLFEQAAQAELSAPETRAGAAFWAARAHRRRGDASGARLWLRRAAGSPQTFYGLLAARMAQELDTGGGMLGAADVAAVSATPEGRRAFALLQIGQPASAEAALRQLTARAPDAALGRSIALVAQAAGLNTQAALGIQAAWSVAQPRAAAIAAEPARRRLRPAHGFTVDPALVYALTRVESNFDAHARSSAGAHGLMQIMPVTAGFVLAGRPSSQRTTRVALRTLDNAGLNLDIGQLYLRYLARARGINGDLIRLLASYNAGPVALAQWSRDAASDGGDPLLFIEALPAPETRDFVHRTLCALWIYNAGLARSAPSLDMLALGRWPRFEAAPGSGATAAAEPDEE